MPNVSPYIPTYISISNLQGGYVAVYDDLGAQYLYQNTTNGSIELPYESNGTWSYKVARYGYKLVSNIFTIDRNTGGTVLINPTYTQDTNITNTQLSAVSAYSSFTNTSHIYDYLSFYRTTSAGLAYGDLNQYISTLDIGSKNIILFDSASQPFSYDGSTFTLRSSNLSGAAIKTTGTITLSGTSSISDIELTTNVLDKTPNDLTNVKINGTLIYDTGSDASITYTNTTISTVVNEPGTGIILIKRVNSTINNATDPQIQNYAPTVINVTPLSGSVAIYNNLGVRQNFITTNSTVVLPFSATGTWTYRVAKYGFDTIYQTFDINNSTGATINVNPNYIPDPFITDTLTNVINYTNLNTANKIHDYLSYFQTLSTGIDYGDLESESFGTITFTGGVILSATSPAMVTVSGTQTNNNVFLKSSNFTDNVIIVSPGTFTLSPGNTISDGVKVRSSNLDSEFYFNNVDLIVFYPSEAARDNNTLTNIVSSSGTIYRFKYGSTVNGVTFADFIYCRVTVGTTTLLNKTALVAGSTNIDFGTTGNLQTILNNQRIINGGVQRASKLIPYSTNI